MKKLIVVIVILSCLCLFLSAYILYDKGYFQKEITVIEEENIEEQEDEKDKYTYSIEDDLVQQLYSYVRSYNLFDQQLIYLVEENDKVLTEDIEQEILNYFGYRQLKTYQITSELCSNYPSVVNSDYYICSVDSDISLNQDASSNATIVFSEDDLEEQVEKIFGKNSYNPTDAIAISFTDYYIYDLASKNYVHATIAGGGTSILYIKELIDVSMQDTDLILEELITSDYEESINLTVFYQFKLDSDNNYYLYSIYK